MENELGSDPGSGLVPKQKTHFRVEVGDDDTTIRSVSLFHFLICGRNRADKNPVRFF